MSIFLPKLITVTTLSAKHVAQMLHGWKISKITTCEIDTTVRES